MATPSTGILVNVDVVSGDPTTGATDPQDVTDNVVSGAVPRSVVPENEPESKVTENAKWDWYEALLDEDCVRVMKLLATYPGLRNVGWKEEPDREVQGRVRHGKERRRVTMWMGRTALHVGARRGCVELVRKVLGMFLENSGLGVPSGPQAPSSSTSSNNERIGLPWDSPQGSDPTRSVGGNVIKRRMVDTTVNVFSLAEILAAKDGQYELDALAMAVLIHDGDIIQILQEASFKCPVNPYEIWEDPTVTQSATRITPYPHTLAERLGQITTRVMSAPANEDAADLVEALYLQDEDFNFLPLEIFLFHMLCKSLDQEVPREDEKKQEEISRAVTSMRREIFQGVNSDATLVRFLLELQDGQGRTPFHIAIEEGQAWFICDLPLGDLQRSQVRQWLIGRDSSGRTPLQRASAMGKVDPGGPHGMDYLEALGLLEESHINALRESPRYTNVKFDIDKLSARNGFANTVDSPVPTSRAPPATPALAGNSIVGEVGFGTPARARKGNQNAGMWDIAEFHPALRNTLLGLEEYTPTPPRMTGNPNTDLLYAHVRHTALYSSIIHQSNRVLGCLLELGDLDMNIKSGRDDEGHHNSMFWRPVQLATILGDTKGVDAMLGRQAAQSRDLPTTLIDEIRIAFYLLKHPPMTGTNRASFLLVLHLIALSICLYGYFVIRGSIADGVWVFLRLFLPSESVSDRRQPNSLGIWQLVSALIHTTTEPVRTENMLTTKDQVDWFRRYFHDSPLRWSPLDIAASSGNFHMVKFFISHGRYENFAEFAEDGNTALHHAVGGNSVEFHTHLLDYISCTHVSHARAMAKEAKKRKEDVERRDAERQGCIDLLLQVGFDVWKSNMVQEIPHPASDASASFLKWWYARLTKQTQVAQDALNVTANAVLLTATLVATASFVGPLQPPLSYDLHDIKVKFVWVRMFITFSALSFYFAVASITLALIPSLPMPQESAIDGLRHTRRTVTAAVVFLFPSIIFVLVAFASASITVVPDHGDWNRRNLTLVTLYGGGFICAAVMFIFALRLLRLLFYRFPEIRNLYRSVFL